MQAVKTPAESVKPKVELLIWERDGFRFRVLVCLNEDCVAQGVGPISDDGSSAREFPLFEDSENHDQGRIPLRKRTPGISEGEQQSRGG